MPSINKHPLYESMRLQWEVGRDCYDGEVKIKDEGVKYLPPTSGQVADGMVSADSIGLQAYNSYRMRAHFPDIYKDAVQAAIGIMHKHPPLITLPPSLEQMIDDATPLGESLEMVLRNINAGQLITGRLGLLADIKIIDGEVKPVLVTYNELAIVNWDDVLLDNEASALKLVVLDESCYKMDAGLDWNFVTQYRVLGIAGEDGKLSENGFYGSALVEEGNDISSTMLSFPTVVGQKTPEIPFVFVNASDISPSPDSPPLNGLARACLTIYRGEADYRQSLFAQGQDTLVRIGANNDEEVVRTGAGARIDVNIGGDAKYIGVSSQGLPEQRQSLENDYARAIQKSGQLLDATSRSKESGDALRIRIAAQTATLPQIAKTGAAAMEKVLKSLARWYGADPDEVSVIPNLNFVENQLNGQTLLQLIQAKSLGAPISEQTIHDWMNAQGVTSFNYDEEIDKIAAEEPIAGVGIEGEPFVG